MYTISIAATLLTLAGLELMSLIFKSIGMKSSVLTFSTSSKEILPQVSRRFNSKDYLVVSYNLDRQVQGEYTNYQVTMVIKSKKSYDEGYLLQLMQDIPEVTVEKIELWESLLFFRQIFPIAHGHVLFVLPGIEAFLDADCLEIGFPERLEKLFVSVHQTFVEHAGDKMSFATVLTKSHLVHLLQVVIVPIGSPDVINQPTLVGKTVLEMPRHQRKGILFGLDGSKESTVRSFLEADKLKQAYTLPIHPLPLTLELHHI